MEKPSVLPENPHPRASANVLSAATFWWTLALFKLGLKREIEVTDLFAPLKEHKSEYLGTKFERLWLQEVKLSRTSQHEPSLFRVVFKCFGGYLMLLGLVRGSSEIFIRLAQPLFLGWLISYFTPGSTVSKEEAYWYAAGVVASSLINTIVIHPYMLGVLHLGVKIRVACCSLIYRKALRMRMTSLGETTVGQVVNLLSNDVHRFDQCFIFFHYLWIGPLETLIVAYFVYNLMGLAGLSGILVILLFIPFQGYLGKRTSVIRLRTAMRTDERVRLMNEIITGIQVIKMYTWEKPFAKLVSLARRREMKSIQSASYIRATISAFQVYIYRLAVFISVLVFVLLGNDITAEKAFVVTAYYIILKNTMSHSFPKAIAQIAEASISIKRVQKFLLYDEINNSMPNEIPKADLILNGCEKVKPVSAEEPEIRITKATAKWLPDSPENTLNNISLNIRHGELVAVIGPVGAGKSSLLNVILQELPLLSGTLSTKGTLSYSSQEPWLFSGSVRQNILFGAPYDRTRYHKVIKACALGPDFEIFPHGDKTLIGERGVMLSGGQKARVNLARCVYREADIFLLDDPLSAVDTNVGKQLFDDCITSLLREKCVVLVTHQLQYLQKASKIIILNKGEIEAEGTYSELQQTGLDFAKLLGEQKVEEKTESERKQLQSQISHMSSKSTKSLERLDSEEHGSIRDEPKEVAEMRTLGHVRANVYSSYFSGGGSMCFRIFVAALMVLSPLAASGNDYWLGEWTNMEERGRAIINTTIEDQDDNISFVNSTSQGNTSHILNITANILGTEVSLYIYTALLLAAVLFAIAGCFAFYVLALRSSTKLHDKMYSSISRATMRFFNTNPSGRILNRFAKDLGMIDEALPFSFLDCIQIMLSMLMRVAIVAIVNYWILIPIIIIVIIFFLCRVVYLTTSRSVKRLEGITRSPVFSHLGASLQGLSTIRAFKAQKLLTDEFDKHQDLNSSAFYIFISLSRAFGLWLDMGCVVFIAIVTFSFLLNGEADVLGGSVGLAITQAINLTGTFQWGIRQSAEVENQMTAVERGLEFTQVDQESALESSPGSKPPSSWPSKGKIIFDKVYLRYDKTEPIVLKNLSFTINSMEKVGVVGRTGAGKSSLIAALFRLVEIEGKISIDGINIQAIGLHELRSKISIIPQEPVLFSGTLRRNLDPFDEYSDACLWQALEEVELKGVVDESAAGLNLRVAEGGSNFSVGQRQLVCLARAIIRNNKILVLDEATANVDPRTDTLIQTTIRRKFADCTVLTIAHRLHTVIDSDKVLVMDAGEAVEFAHPHELLQDSSSTFSSMVQKLGKHISAEFISLASENYKNSIHQKTS